MAARMDGQREKKMVTEKECPRVGLRARQKEMWKALRMGCRKETMKATERGHLKVVLMAALKVKPKISRTLASVMWSPQKATN